MTQMTSEGIFTHWDGVESDLGGVAEPQRPGRGVSSGRGSGRLSRQQPVSSPSACSRWLTLDGAFAAGPTIVTLSPQS
jgi:hypothetical protein